MEIEKVRTESPKAISSFSAKIAACAIVLCIITGLRYTGYGSFFTEKISHLVSYNYDFSQIIKKTEKILKNKSFKAPVKGVITSHFEDTHKGLDIAADEGTSVCAAYSGKVTKAEDAGDYGNCVMISHEDGTVTLYAHLSKISVKSGDTVKTGDEIGKVGSTGNSTGPHLHFEVRLGDKYIDPASVTSGL